MYSECRSERVDEIVYFITRLIKNVIIVYCILVCYYIDAIHLIGLFSIASFPHEVAIFGSNFVAIL